MPRKRKVVIEIPTLERDAYTGALLNRSKSSHMQHRARKSAITNRNTEVTLLRDEVSTLRAEMLELKQLLKTPIKEKTRKSKEIDSTSLPIE
jgi:Tfp pilus assembly protein PilN